MSYITEDHLLTAMERRRRRGMAIWAERQRQLGPIRRPAPQLQLPLSPQIDALNPNAAAFVPQQPLPPPVPVPTLDQALDLWEQKVREAREAGYNYPRDRIPPDWHTPNLLAHHIRAAYPAPPNQPFREIFPGAEPELLRPSAKADSNSGINIYTYPERIISMVEKSRRQGDAAFQRHLAGYDVEAELEERQAHARRGRGRRPRPLP